MLPIAPTHGHIHVHHISLTVLLNINCVHLYGFVSSVWLSGWFWTSGADSYSIGQGPQSPHFGLPSAMIVAGFSSPGWFLHCLFCVSIPSSSTAHTGLISITTHQSTSSPAYSCFPASFTHGIPLLFHIDFSSTFGGGESSCWKSVEITALNLFVENCSFRCCLSAETWLASQLLFYLLFLFILFLFMPSFLFSVSWKLQHLLPYIRLDCI